MQIALALKHKFKKACGFWSGNSLRGIPVSRKRMFDKFIRKKKVLSKDFDVISYLKKLANAMRAKYNFYLSSRNSFKALAYGPIYFFNGLRIGPRQIWIVLGDLFGQKIGEFAVNDFVLVGDSLASDQVKFDVALSVQLNG